LTPRLRRRRPRPRPLPPRPRAKRMPHLHPQGGDRSRDREGIDLGDIAKYGGAAFGAGAALLFAYRDKIVDALKGKKEEELSDEEKEEIICAYWRSYI